ncbi:MAG: hypothetical protein KBD64_06725 [Gammaproteobacteria bacterium]|nr:hypothetical protein [Gammaproteobacteria bacterium]
MSFFEVNKENLELLIEGIITGLRSGSLAETRPGQIETRLGSIKRFFLLAMTPVVRAKVVGAPGAREIYLADDSGMYGIIRMQIRSLRAGLVNVVFNFEADTGAMLTISAPTDAGIVPLASLPQGIILFLSERWIQEFFEAVCNQLSLGTPDPTVLERMVTGASYVSGGGVSAVLSPLTYGLGLGGGAAPPLDHDWRARHEDGFDDGEIRRAIELSRMLVETQESNESPEEVAAAAATPAAAAPARGVIPRATPSSDRALTGAEVERLGVISTSLSTVPMHLAAMAGTGRHNNAVTTSVLQRLEEAATFLRTLQTAPAPDAGTGTVARSRSRNG